MGKLTVEQKVHEYNRGKKAQVKVAHVLGVSRGHTTSNAMNGALRFRWQCRMRSFGPDDLIEITSSKSLSKHRLGQN